MQSKTGNQTEPAICVKKCAMLDKRYPKELVLKDHSEVLLRPLEEGDTELFVRFFKELPFKNRWYMKENPCDSAVIGKWIQNQKTGKTFCVLALFENRIVAHASLLMRLHGGRKHVGHLRLMVASDFRKKQLGTWLIFDIIRRAMDFGLEKIRTDFIIGVEDMAIKGVRKLDFVKEGLLKDYIKDEQGNYYDYQIMVKRLHQDWSDF